MKNFSQLRESIEDLQEVNSVMSVDKKNMPKAKPIIQKLARARGVPVEFDKDGIGVTFKGRPKDVEKLMKDFEKNKTLMKLLEANESVEENKMLGGDANFKVVEVKSGLIRLEFVNVRDGDILMKKDDFKKLQKFIKTVKV